MNIDSIILNITQNLDSYDKSLESICNFDMDISSKKIFKYLWVDYWNLYVPNSGQSEILQAELLRRISKLENEAKNNGNINWDSDFDYFCKFLQNKFAEFRELEAYQDNINLILDKIRFHGQYSQFIHLDEFPESLWNVKYIAYTDDSLYQYLYDKVCMIYLKYPDPIPFKKELNVYR